MGPGHTIVTCLCDSGQVRSMFVYVCVCIDNIQCMFILCYNPDTNMYQCMRDIYVVFQQRYYARLFNREWMKSKGLLDSIPDSYHNALH